MQRRLFYKLRKETRCKSVDRIGQNMARLLVFEKKKVNYTFYN